MRGSFGRWLTAAALVLGACPACSSSSQKGFPGGTTPPDAAVEAGPSAATACDDFAQAVCDQLATCTPFALKEAFGDVKTCAQRSAIPCPGTLAASGVKMTPAALEKCVQVIKGQTCDEALDNPQPAECSVPGTLGAGAPCGNDWQCATDFCQLVPGKLCGACATRASSGQRAPDGGVACVVDDDCAAKLLCGAGTCVSPGAVGAVCSGAQPCQRTLTCIGGKCATPLAAGATCSAATDCNGSLGLYCETAGTKKCVQAGTAATGQPCGVVSGTLVACTNGDLCAGIDMQGQGTCHEPAADGAPCGTLAGIGCSPPAACIDDTGYKCVLPDPGSCH
ncbi:MAG TPA: hypothetical protein VF765_17570 [Polyangiaceae bacterium]